MYTPERQRAQPYLDTIDGPLFEQWYLLHHRMIRIVANRERPVNDVRHFLYYAELLAEYTYQHPSELPVDIPVDLFWQAGERLYRPIALTFYLFETTPGEAFPPAPAEEKPEDTKWEIVPGVEGSLQAQWKRESLRFRAFQAQHGVSSCIATFLDKSDLHATIYIENVAECTSWFLMRYVFYMLLGGLFGSNGFEIIHAAAIALDGNGALLIGSPTSGKTTLVLSSLQLGMQHLADDVLFLAKDDGLVHTYGFPEDIGIRAGTAILLAAYECIRTLPEKDEREKRYVDIQRHFRHQIITSCPVRVIFFIDSDNRQPEFLAEQVSPALAVSWLMQEYIAQSRAEAGEADYMFDIFSDMLSHVVPYNLYLSFDVDENARQICEVMQRHVDTP